MRGCAALVLLAGCAPTLNYTPRSAKLFNNENGTEVAIVEVDTPEGPRALIRVRGVPTEISDLVLLYEADASKKGMAYVTTLDGHNFSAVWLHDYPKALTHTLYLPETPYTSIKLEIDKERSQSVDANEMIATHARQLEDGSIARLAQFNRQESLAELREAINNQAKASLAQCGLEVPLEVDWQSFDDELIYGERPRLCTEATSAIAHICKRSNAAKKILGGEVKHIACTHGTMGLEFHNGELKYTTGIGTQNAAQFVTKRLRHEINWPSIDQPLDELVRREETILCTDGKIYVGLFPRKSIDERGSLFFGDDKSLTMVEHPGGVIHPTWFFEPREFNPNSNENLRGVDYRYHSSFDGDKDHKKQCRVQCGERSIPLQYVTDEAKDGVLANAPFSPPISKRRPYAMSRDRKGTYYYVDTGKGKDAKRFRLYSGRKGALKELKMTNIVSDSHGDIFSTKSGSLRLILEKEESYWVQEDKTEKLINLPLHENWNVIYNELGIYTGQPYGTPCDVL